MSKFLKDSTLNIISNLLVVIAVQLVAFPVINKRVESEDFALLIVFYGIAIVVATSLGNTLNNVRLLHREGFRDSERESIFSKIFLLLLALNFILYTIICLFYNKEISIDMFFMVMFSILLTARYYLNVYFRENLNYKNILFVNMFVFIGYFFGIGIFVILNKFYSMVFFMGELFGFIFLIKKSGFLNYFTWKKTKDIFKMKLIIKDFLNFSFINIIINILNYLDRFILLPIIGPVLVNVYFIASTASKMIGLVTTPINNVILSYLTVGDDNSNLKKFSLINIVAVIASIPLFFIVKYSSLLIVYILYNNYLEKVYSFINLVVIICILQIYISVFHPFTMKMITSKIIVYIQIGYAIIYLMLAFLFSNLYGLTGFCWATILAMLIKLISTNVIVFRVTSLKKGKTTSEL